MQVPHSHKEDASGLCAVSRLHMEPKDESLVKGGASRICLVSRLVVDPKIESLVKSMKLPSMWVVASGNGSLYELQIFFSKVGAMIEHRPRC